MVHCISVLRKGAGKGLGNDPVDTFDLMCAVTQVSPTLPEGSDCPTGVDAQNPTVQKASPGEGVEDVDPTCAPPGALRTLLQAAPPAPDVPWLSESLDSSKVKLFVFYGAILGVLVLVLLKTEA